MKTKGGKNYGKFKILGCDGMYYFKFHKILIFGRFCTHPLIGNLEKRNIGFLSLQESIDTTTSGGKLIFHIFGALAEFERNLIQERTKAGLIAARQRGKKGGRPKSIYYI